MLTPEEMKERTKAFGLAVIEATESLPKDRRAANVLGKRLLRAGTSLGANYRAACRARDAAEFVAKLGIVEDEADESIYWMEMLIEAGLLPAKRMEKLMQEAQEILAITVASMKTAQWRKQPKS